MDTRKICKIIKEMNDIISSDFSKRIDWAKIVAWPVNETRMINGTFNTKTYQDRTEARFITRLPPKTEFPEHWHDVGECCEVQEGVLADLLSGQVWAKGEIAVFPTGTNHTPHNPSPTDDTRVLVTFKK
jgi:hypothetical protein